MWWPTNLLKSNFSSPSTTPHIEQNQTSFFAIPNDIDLKPKPRHIDHAKQVSKHSLSIEDEQVALGHGLGLGLGCGKSFVMHMPSMTRNRKSRKGVPSTYRDSDDIEVEEDVLIIGRTRSFERSLAERLDGSPKGPITSRRSISRKVSNQAIQPGSIGRRYHSFFPTLNSTTFTSDVIKGGEEDHFMLDLDEAWHPHGYSSRDRDHTEFLVELRGMASGDESDFEDEHITRSMVRTMRPRRSAVPREEAMGGLRETFPVSPTSAADSPIAVVAPQLQLAPVTVSMEMSEVLQDKPRSMSGASSPGSVTLSFRGKPRWGSKGCDGDVFGISLPEEAVDMTDVYVHLGPSPHGENFRDAMHGQQEQGAGKEPVPRSNSMSSIPSPTSARSFSDERRKRHSTIDLAVLATHTEDGNNDDDGWFKLAKRENESWADFSQTLSRSKGAAVWQKLEKGERVPLPEPSFVGVSPRRRAATEDNRCLVPDGDQERKFNTLSTGIANRDEPRSLSPTSQAITYSPSLERLTCGALPFLCETLQGSTFGGLPQRALSSPAEQHPFAGVPASMASARASTISPAKFNDRQRSRTEFSHGFRNNSARIIPAQTGR